ncbi:hypothetical protein E4U59_007516 [Claviceps monticola]|nr:hypothetical protein E4U59_007516 [Claviceps monticola]
MNINIEQTRKNFAPLPHLELTSNFPQLTIQTYHQKLYRRLDPSRQSARRDPFSFLKSLFTPISGLPNSPVMTGRGGGGGGGGGRRVLLPPINMIFKLLQSNATVSVWLYEQLSIRIEGKIRGFDEFMNLVIDDAVEVSQITKTNEEETRRSLGTYAPRSTSAASGHGSQADSIEQARFSLRETTFR